ncbi:undecaprenyl-phosphate galactose phosphotransferase [Haemophilus influenzae]|uniref:Undecaprenyl-phosphate galactose phosphotransferase n=1 Tax=Haemophilus influenzae TaxID=727 RepID=A0A2X1RJQ9_HAEIF|nr:undecaprenyl-phosphate galactose phosphotransferase [Haemophilus influenzae]
MDIPRIGRNGKTFNCLKFRSLIVNSKEVLDELLRTDPQARAEWEKILN